MILLFAITASLAVAAAAANTGPAFVCSMTERTNHDRLDATFVVIDEPQGKGIVIGRKGTADVLVVRADFGISFIEVPTGGVMAATIVIPRDLAATAVSKDTTFPIVYSRNAIMFDHLLPSQYTGQCTEKS